MGGGAGVGGRARRVAGELDGGGEDGVALAAEREDGERGVLGGAEGEPAVEDEARAVARARDVYTRGGKLDGKKERRGARNEKRDSSKQVTTDILTDCAVMRGRERVCQNVQSTR